MRRPNRFPVLSFAVLSLALTVPAVAQTSKCDLNSNGAVNNEDIQKEIREALGDIGAADDLNHDGLVNVVDVQIVIDATLQLGCVADNTLPAVTAINPTTGKAGDTVTITIAGQGLSGALYALHSVDPVDQIGSGPVNVVSETGQTAIISMVLALEGPYNLIVTNVGGGSSASAATLFSITPATATVSFNASVLDRIYTITGNEYGPHNSSNFLASVLNTVYPITGNSYGPHNSSSFQASVLNSNYTITGFPALPAGQNDASVYASVLNTHFSGTVSWSRAAASLGVSVCNTTSGCVPIPARTISANAAHLTSSAKPVPPTSVAPSRNLLPELGPLEESTSVIVGQTIRLTARNADPGSVVEFEVNRSVIATVTEAPYETLFTVPEGPEELVFQVAVRDAGLAERRSQITRMTVVQDGGATISGSVAQGDSGLELSLSAGGLKAEYFHLAQPVTALPVLDVVEPVNSGYVTAINEPNPRAIFGDDPLGARLSPDYAIRFSGEVRADVSGQYRFWLSARSGAAIFIDGKLLADSGFVSGEPAEASASIALERGWHSLAVIYYLAVGASSLRLEWQQPNGSRREVVGPESLRTTLTGMNTVSSPDGAFAFPKIPGKFDSVWIRAKSGNGWLEFPAVKPGASQVSLSVPQQE